MNDLIEILNEHDYDVPVKRLENAIEKVLLMEALPENASLTVAIEDNEAVRVLNQQFRGIDSATDVLSFPSGEVEFDDSSDNDDVVQEDFDEDDEIYLGDLAIAYPYAKAQADREGHDLADSLVLLVVHGTLHLIGYDHDTPENRKQMWAVQGQILVELGVSTAIVPALEGDLHA
ncbi:MAG: rRNA maturation RNase YbeY [Aggregatilineales bacterium]